MKLRSLEPSGYRLVTPELASGKIDRWSEDAWRPFISDAARPIELDPFEAVVDEAIEKFAPRTSDIDAWLAARIHRALPLTRREASNAGVWRYLAVVRRPDFIRHRWEMSSWTTTRPRYWSVGLRHTSIAFARLWWIAELTRDGESYELTKRVLARQGSRRSSSSERGVVSPRGRGMRRAACGCAGRTRGARGARAVETPRDRPARRAHGGRVEACDRAVDTRSVGATRLIPLQRVYQRIARSGSVKDLGFVLTETGHPVGVMGACQSLTDIARYPRLDVSVEIVGPFDVVIDGKPQTWSASEKWEHVREHASYRRSVSSPARAS